MYIYILCLFSGLVQFTKAVRLYECVCVCVCVCLTYVCIYILCLFSGLVQFTKAVRLYETQDPEVASLNQELRAFLMPPVGVSPPAAMGQNGAS